MEVSRSEYECTSILKKRIVASKTRRYYKWQRVNVIRKKKLKIDFWEGDTGN